MNVKKNNKEDCRKEKRKKFVQYCKVGQPTKYNAEKHLGLLYDVFSRGEDITAFCAEASITRATFYAWLKAHKEFRFGYDIAINIAARMWEQVPFTKQNFNYHHWLIIMRNRFGYGKPKLETIKNVTSPLDRFEAIWKGLESGELSINEANQLTAIINNHSNLINNQSNKDDRMATIDSKEALNNKIQALTAVLNYINKPSEDLL